MLCPHHRAGQWLLGLCVCTCEGEYLCACERVNTCFPWGSLTGWPLDPGSPWVPGSPVPPSVPRLPGGPSCPGNPLSPLKKHQNEQSKGGNGPRGGKGGTGDTEQWFHGVSRAEISGCWAQTWTWRGLRTSASSEGKSSLPLAFQGPPPPLSHTASPLYCFFPTDHEVPTSAPPPTLFLLPRRWPPLLSSLTSSLGRGRLSLLHLLSSPRVPPLPIPTSSSGRVRAVWIHSPPSPLQWLALGSHRLTAASPTQGRFLKRCLGGGSQPQATSPSKKSPQEGAQGQLNDQLPVSRAWQGAVLIAIGINDPLSQVQAWGRDP